ncbi:hypothetical protein AVEN_175537-1 [Araneus ventricosus]|uniref:Uncharacterized protein n=1 Tax=Araneus ventricosus TaxID=182803 RepID=A0A4Y2CPK7_ARAVE|nr:hypothetical protein AVEN_175537-1 [Araneus ventricosus]
MGREKKTSVSARVRHSNGCGGLVVRSRLRNWWVPGSKTDSIKDPSYDFYFDRKPRKPRSCELAYLFTAWYFWISLLCVCFMFMTLLMVCVLCCCRNKKNDTSSVLGRILLSLPPTLFTSESSSSLLLILNFLLEA